LTGHFVADPPLYLGNGLANLLRGFVPICSASLIGASLSPHSVEENRLPHALMHMYC
jgi:hypothetical protein